MPPFNHFTTKAKEAIRRAHELAIERGQNHVSSVHLLAALLTQEESMVISILDKLEIDTMLLVDNVLESIESPEGGKTLSPSYQIYLTPDLAAAIDQSSKIAAHLKDEFVSTEHLFLAILEVPGDTREILGKFRLTKELIEKTLEEFKSNSMGESDSPKKTRMLNKYTRNLIKLAREDKLDPVIGRDTDADRCSMV
jgi:ATP-dependent Clp protease ATP-binding subunit ClpB